MAARGRLLGRRRLAASSINAQTSCGIEASEAWLALSVMTFLRQVFPTSLFHSLYHDGLFFQAGFATFSPKTLPTGAFCVTAVTSASSHAIRRR